MFLVHELPVAIAFCAFSMLGWGSWANTQKLAQKRNWPFELFYWDYAIGVLLCGIALALTLGTFGPIGPSALDTTRRAAARPLLHALASGALFNVANILLVTSIDRAGFAVSFPVGIGLALVIGTFSNYSRRPQGNGVLLIVGICLVLLAMVASSAAHLRVDSKTSSRPAGLLLAAASGTLMGLFYPELLRSIATDFTNAPVTAGLLSPYAALAFFGLGLVGSNLLLNSLLMRIGGVRYSAYFSGGLGVHLLGVAGGMIWMLALTANLLASGVAGPAISYALGQGATLVAAIWGVFVWREFRHGPSGTGRLLALMFSCYFFGMLLVGAAAYF